MDAADGTRSASAALPALTVWSRTKSSPPAKPDGELFSFQAARLGARVRDGATGAIRGIVGVLATHQAGQTEQTQQARQTPQAIVAAVVFLLLRQRGRRGRCFKGRRVRHARAAEQQRQGGDSYSK